MGFIMRCYKKRLNCSASFLPKKALVCRGAFFDPWLASLPSAALYRVYKDPLAQWAGFLGRPLDFPSPIVGVGKYWVNPFRA